MKELTKGRKKEGKKICNNERVCCWSYWMCILYVHTTLVYIFFLILFSANEQSVVVVVDIVVVIIIVLFNYFDRSFVRSQMHSLLHVLAYNTMT